MRGTTAPWGEAHRFRFVNAVPLHASNADVRVNFI